MIDQRVVKGVCLENSEAKLNVQYASFSNRLKEQGPKIIFKYLSIIWLWIGDQDLLCVGTVPYEKLKYFFSAPTIQNVQFTHNETM